MHKFNLKVGMVLRYVEKNEEYRGIIEALSKCILLYMCYIHKCIKCCIDVDFRHDSSLFVGDILLCLTCDIVCATRFKESDAFVGYQKDVAAAVVFQASSQLRKTCERLRGEVRGQQQLWEIVWGDGLLGPWTLDQLAREEEGSESWAQAVRTTSIWALFVRQKFYDFNICVSMQ